MKRDKGTEGTGVSGPLVALIASGAPIMLRKWDVAEAIGRSEKALDRLIADGRFPKGSWEDGVLIWWSDVVAEWLKRRRNNHFG